MISTQVSEFETMLSQSQKHSRLNVVVFLLIVKKRQSFPLGSSRRHHISWSSQRVILKILVQRIRVGIRIPQCPAGGVLENDAGLDTKSRLCMLKSAFRIRENEYIQRAQRSGLCCSPSRGLRIGTGVFLALGDKMPVRVCETWR